MLIKDNHNFQKKQGITTKLKINLKTHYTQVSFIWIKEGRNKSSMTKETLLSSNSVGILKSYSTEDTVFSIECD